MALLQALPARATRPGSARLRASCARPAWLAVPVLIKFALAAACISSPGLILSSFAAELLYGLGREQVDDEIGRYLVLKSETRLRRTTSARIGPCNLKDAMPEAPAYYSAWNGQTVETCLVACYPNGNEAYLHGRRGLVLLSGSQRRVGRGQPLWNGSGVEQAFPGDCSLVDLGQVTYEHLG